MKRLSVLLALFPLAIASPAQAEEGEEPQIEPSCIVAAERMLDLAAEQIEIDPDRRDGLVAQLAARLSGAEMPMCGMIMMMPDTTLRALARQTFSAPPTADGGAKSE